MDGQFELKFLFENILNTTTEELEKKNLITVVESKNYIFFKTQEKITLSNELLTEYQNLIGLKNFLSDYSNIEEKMNIEVQIWENYLIFANLLGIADKVKQQFKKIYPAFNDLDKTFEVSFDNTIPSYANRLYKKVKLELITIIIAAILIAIMFFEKDNIISIIFKIPRTFDISGITKPILVLFPFIITGGLLYYSFLRQYLLNRKVKEMNKTTYAKITDVDIYYSERTDSDGNSYNSKEYHLKYEYIIDGISYTGSGYSKSKKYINQKIKIYYNEQRPTLSETAKEHNQNLKTFIWSFSLLLLFLYLLIKSGKQ